MSTAKLALYEDDTQAWGLIEGDSVTALAQIPDASIDAVICDPPYGISIGGSSWDGADIRQAVRRDGETLSTGKALERWTAQWAAECRRVLKPGGYMVSFGTPRVFHRLVAGAEDGGLEIRDQLLWLNGQGFPKSRRLPGGRATTLKPAYEPILLARAPFTGTTPRNLAEWGTGALNIEAARITGPGEPAGFWPANVALSHSPGCRAGACQPDCPLPLIDQERTASLPSRLFYCAKATRREREAGCEQLPQSSVQLYTGKRHSPRLRHNLHPTVKPLALMRWLVKLVTPPGGLVLDPFAGSGSTGIAAIMEGRQSLNIEREAAYVDIACARLTYWAHQARESL